ncbi:MAG TPA: MG2 domain-containing protein [Pyrinomonadaceae bacterium]|nr:MG2 domain-containing protein [Pyrinomonadaceae bacterium]
MPRRFLTSFAVYVAVLALVIGFVALRVKARYSYAAAVAPETLNEEGRTPQPPDPHAKPFFSLHTNRTYATSDRARVWVNYRGLDSLDFRVYKVKDPVKFFRQLDNPHQVGEDEAAEVGKAVEKKPDFLERLRQWKSWGFGLVKKYVREQLQNQSRKGFNQKFRPEEDDTSNRTPLNVATDFARVPLLNPDQMVTSWREKLPPLEDVYDRRMISLGKREPGVYLVEAVNGDLRAFGILIVTDIATVQKTSRDGQMLVYAVERVSGQPREGVKVLVVRKKNDVTSGQTDKQGLLKLTIPQKKPAANEDEEGGDEEGASEEGAEEDTTSDSYLVMASEGDNFAISDLDSYYFSAGGDEEGGGDSNLTSYIYTDRPVYRPEQHVYFKGILRTRAEQGYKLPSGPINVTVTDGDGATIYEKELTLSTRGTFSGELDLPEESPLGSYTINAAVGEGESSATGYFTVEEYKKPEYKVKVTTPAAYVRAGEPTRFTVSANYFFGSPVTKASVKYYVYRSRYYGWWQEGGSGEEDEFGADPTADDSGASADYGEEMVLEGDGKLNEQGRLDIDFKVPAADPKDTWDYTYRLEAEVTDAARRSMSESGSFTGVRSNVVAYAYPDRYVYAQGDAAHIKVQARDREGRPVQTRVKLTFFERRWQKVIKKTEDGYEYPDYETKEKELSSVDVNTNEQGEGATDYTAPQPGSILIKTTVDEAGKPVVMEAGSLWIADRNGQWEDVSYDAEGEIKLVPDKKSYQPGETAHVLALLPKEKAHLLVTTELDGVMNVRQMDVSGRAAIVDLPIEPRFAPNVFLNVTYVRGSEMYTQDAEIKVPARDKLLNVEIIPNKKEFKPREPISYTVMARNADGSPAAGAEVSLGVVDESIYSIAPESVGDIRREFYGQRYSSVSTSFSVNYYFSGYAGKKVIELAQKKRARQLADFKDESTVNPLVRKIFKDTAFWQPALVTGPDGKAQAKFELPDNLTTWRATARAVTADTKVGVAVSKVVERKDVILRVAMPRFLTAGDTVTLSGIVHNYLKADKVTKITADVAGAKLLDPAEQTVTIPSQGEYRINWRVQATATGDLKILAKALTDTESDAIETGIPIVPRGLKNVRADSLAFSDDEADKTVTLNLPANADPNARTLRVEASPTIAGALFGALDYLTSFPYGCTEQTMSSFLPNVIVTQALQNVQTANIRDTNDITKKVNKGLKRLYAYQHGDGGWGWWKDDKTDAWMTAYVVDGLIQAQAAGYEVDSTKLEQGRAALRKMLEAGADENGTDFSKNMDARAYAAYSLSAAGDADMRFLNDIFNNRAKLGAYGRAQLALALKGRNDGRAQAVASEIEKSAKGNGAEAFWENTEATALSVKALARTLPQSEVLPKAARWLVGHRRFGYYWLSTRETAFAVYGLIDYLKVSHELEANYSVEIYVNGQQVLQKQLTGADTQAFVMQRRGGEVGQTNEIRVVKHGPGVLYLATTLTHYTNDEQTAEAGVPQLKLHRDYLRLKVVDKGDEGLGWETEPLSGDVRSGDIIVSRLRLEGEPGQYLMIEDPIPAGCEQVEEVGGLTLGNDQKDWSDWYSQREFRDNRTVFFLNGYGNKAQLQYAMRVQVPGQFRAAPARAERMYEPDVRANSATAGLTIQDK